MVYIVCYRLKRKNARRRIAMKMNVDSVEKAIRDFKIYADVKNDPNRTWELLTGDWKQVTFYESK